LNLRLAAPWTVLLLLLLLLVPLANLPAKADSSVPLYYTVNNAVTIDGAGWAYVDTNVTITNNSTVDSGAFVLNMTYFGQYPPYTYDFRTDGNLASVTVGDNATTYFFNVANVPASSNLTINLHARLWGVIDEPSPSSYTYNFTTFPITLFPNGFITNATAALSFVQDVSVTSDLPGLGFTRLAATGPSYVKYYFNETQLQAEVVRVNFTASSTSTFALYRIKSVDRTLSLTGDGAVQVTDRIVIWNQDTADITVLNLTSQPGGSYHLKEGILDGGVVSLDFGLLNLPFPISARSYGDIVLTYVLDSSAVSSSDSSLIVTVGSKALTFINMVDHYSLRFNFPQGSAAQASGALDYYNVTTMPAVVVTANVPFAWGLAGAAPAAVGVLAALVFLFFLFRRQPLQPYEEEGLSIIRSKAQVITGLIEQYRLRGEGYSPFDSYSAERKALEEEKSRIAMKLADYKARPSKEKAQKTFVDKIVADDAKLEQLYREAKQMLEERTASRLSEKDFSSKMQNLERSAQSFLTTKKPSKKQEPAKPAKP
jgi:hypothetical protein